MCRRVVKGKVLKMDGPSAQGFLSLTGPLAPRVVDCPSGNAYKVSVTDSPFCVIWHDKHSAELSAFGRYTPYPAAPDFHLKVKRLTMICALLALLHPLLSLTHWIFRSRMLPYKSSSHSANHVRCASTGKRVTRFSGRFASLRIVFPCHPCSGGRIKHRETFSS